MNDFDKKDEIEKPKIILISEDRQKHASEHLSVEHLWNVL